MSPKRLRLRSVVGFLVSAVACDNVVTGLERDERDPPLGPQVVSKSARVKQKPGELYTATLAQALSLDPQKLCLELGRYPCASEVHKITLAGVEPYRLGIRQPIPQSLVTAPIAAQRIALSACTRRAALDFAAPAAAKIFQGLPQRNGRLVDVQDPSVGQAIDRLYRRLLQRKASPQEEVHLKTLYEDMVIVDETYPDITEAWAAVACFAVATTLESLFY